MNVRVNGWRSLRMSEWCVRLYWLSRSQQGKGNSHLFSGQTGCGGRSRINDGNRSGRGHLREEAGWGRRRCCQVGLQGLQGAEVGSHALQGQLHPHLLKLLRREHLLMSNRTNNDPPACLMIWAGARRVIGRPGKPLPLGRHENGGRWSATRPGTMTTTR